MKVVFSKIKQIFLDKLPEILYMIAVPFYMVEISYIVMLSRNNYAKNLDYITPLFLGTVWIPAFLSFTLNHILKKIFQGNKKSKWIRNYPSVFIAMYSVYFFILSQFDFAKNCLSATLAGMVLIVFLFILKNAQKDMFYLPPPKEFWFYTLTFIPPIAILFFTDVYFLILKDTPYFIVLSPVSYIPEILGFWLFCCIKRHSWKEFRKKKLTLFHAILIMQLINIGTSFYFASIFGDKIIWICMTICLATILCAEQFSRYKPLD